MKLKMWFFFLRIKKALHKFYHLSIFIKLRKSFAYTFLKMFALILAVLWFQFLILPHFGYIDIPDPMIVDNIDILSDKVKFFGNSGYLNIEDFTHLDLHITNAKFSIGDIEYSDDIIIKINGLSNGASIGIHYGQDFAMYLESISDTVHYTNEYPSTMYYGSTASGVDENTIYSPNSIYLICISSTADVYLVGEDDQRRILVAENRLDFKLDSFFSIDIDGNHSVWFSSGHQDSETDYTFDFYQLKFVSCEATGNVVFSDSPDKKEYSLHNQVFTFKTNVKDSEAVLVSDINGYQLATTTCVSSADIGGYNLFPSFRNWYYNNLYIAPLTLLSVVISSVAIIFKKT